MTVYWTGKVVTVNKWHSQRFVWRTTSTGRKKVPIISPSREYETFVADLSIAIMAEARRCGFVNLPTVNLRLQCNVGPLVDDQNLLKPVCDAIERAGVVKNDRDIGFKVIVPGERHKRGKPDEVWIMLSRDPFRVSTRDEEEQYSPVETTR